MKRQYQNKKLSECLLPKEVIYNILLFLDLKSVDQLCNTNTCFYEVCQDKHLWKEKYKMDNMNVLFLNDQDINQHIYKLAYDILQNGQHIYNKMLKHEFYKLIFYLPVFDDKMWPLNDYLNTQNIYTGILQLTVYYKAGGIYGSGEYINKVTLIYQDDYQKNKQIEFNVTKHRMIEIIGYLISTLYKEVGRDFISRTYKSDKTDDIYDDEILNRLKEQYFLI